MHCLDKTLCLSIRLFVICKENDTTGSCIGPIFKISKEAITLLTSVSVVRTVIGKIS